MNPDQPTNPPQQQFNQPVNMMQPEPENTGSKKKLILFSFIGVFALVLFVGAFFIFSDSDSSKNSSSETAIVNDRDSLDEDATKEIELKTFFDCSDKELNLPSQPPLDENGEAFGGSFKRLFDNPNVINETVGTCEQVDTPRAISLSVVKAYQNLEKNLTDFELDEYSRDNVVTVFQLKVGYYSSVEVYPEDDKTFFSSANMDILNASGEDVLALSDVIVDGKLQNVRDIEIKAGEMKNVAITIKGRNDQPSSLDGYTMVYTEDGTGGESKVIFQL